MLVRDHALGIRQGDLRLGNLRLREVGEARVEMSEPTSSLRGSTRSKQVLRLFSELLQARSSRQPLGIHTNVR